jgi:hypothetical protein
MTKVTSSRGLKGRKINSPRLFGLYSNSKGIHPHRSRWMNFNVGEKANLYKKYIAKLVNNAKPDMNFDLDLFTGMKIKTIWEMNGDFNNLESIYPNGPKLTITENEANEPPVPTDDDFVPEMEDADDVPL